MNRRTFLPLVMSPFATSLWGRTLSTIGVQLYTVRGVLPKQPLETLKAIHDLGYREVEATYGDLDKIAPLITQAGLLPVSLHLDFALFGEGKEADLAKGLKSAKTYGFRYVVCPYVPPAQRSGLDGMRKLAQRLNEAGAQAQSNGLRLCYHNHAFEFEPLEGTTPFKVLLAETKPQNLALEMDVFWVSVAGQQPVDLLKAYKGRVPLVHLKDKASNVPVQYKEGLAKESFKEVGHGSLDFPAILKAATAAGVQHYFVEQDQTPGDPLASLRESYTFLHPLKY